MVDRRTILRSSLSTPLAALAGCLGGDDGDERTCDPPIDPPADATLSASCDDAGETVTITHERGEPVPLTHVKLWAGAEKFEVEGVGEELESGESFEVPSRQYVEGQLVWAGPCDRDWSIDIVPLRCADA
ncbi:hypothetical protein [Haloarchaeobius sp. DFWS5]|uniref:hypothetical protein n=1 Tax=Haloarchaeobius sp. DFWS5 TaxID=3446114 RepID=UPI003EBB736E